jgi:hypothetical protein
MRGADWRKRVVSRLMATTNRREKILQSSRVRARQRRLIAGVLIWHPIVSRQWGWGTCPVWVKLDRVGRGYTSFHVRNPPIATVMAGCPVPIPHLAAEAATLGSPLPCAPLDVGAISVCIAARPPNFRREKDLLHFLCIGLFVFNFEILRGNARRGTRPCTAPRINTPTPWVTPACSQSDGAEPLIGAGAEADVERHDGHVRFVPSFEVYDILPPGQGPCSRVPVPCYLVTTSD